MKTNSILVSMCLGVFLCGAAQTYGAATFTNRALWEAANPGFTTETFSTPTGLLPIGTTSLANVDVTLFGTANNTTEVAGGQFIGFIQNDPSSNDIYKIRLTFPEPVTAWGADFTSAATGNILISTANGNSYNFSTVLGSPGNGFFGSVEDAPFQWVDLTTASFTFFGEYFQMDNLSFSAVPEPATFLVWSCLSAIGGVIVYRRKRRAA